MNQIGTMRCPVKAIVSVEGGKPTIVDETNRCTGSGPVFEVEKTKAHTLFIRCDTCCPKPEDPPIAMNAGIWRRFVA